MPGRHRREDQLPQREPGRAWAELLRRYREEPPRAAEPWQPEVYSLSMLARLRDGLSRL